MVEKTIKIPDIGGQGEITEICVNVGDTVAIDDPLVVLESDKASIEVPAPAAGQVTRVLVKVGDTLKTEDDFIVLQLKNNPHVDKETTHHPTPEPSPPQQQSVPHTAPPSTPMQQEKYSVCMCRILAMAMCLSLTLQSLLET